MAEEMKTMEELEAEAKKGRNFSLVRKERKNLAYLQEMKNKGKKIVQTCPCELGGFFALSAEMADVDVMRIASDFGGTCTTGNQIDEAMWSVEPTLRKWRGYVNIIHINLNIPTPAYATKGDGVKYGSNFVYCGADSLLPMGVTNEVAKYMADFYVPLYGHVGAISGWQTIAKKYVRCGKTAEDALFIFKMAYEYQEVGMQALSVELTPWEVSEAMTKKLRIPIVGIAGGSPCDGSEQVDVDIFGLMPGKPSHVRQYSSLIPFALDTYSRWVQDVRNGAYPSEENVWHMNADENEKFQEMLAKF